MHFIAGAGFQTHHCVLYSTVGWPLLGQRRKQHSLLYIYEALIGKIPLYLNSLLSINNMTHENRSHDWITSQQCHGIGYDGGGCLQYCCSHYVEQRSSFSLWYRMVYFQRPSGRTAQGKYLQLFKLCAYYGWDDTGKS